MGERRKREGAQRLAVRAGGDTREPLYGRGGPTRSVSVFLRDVLARWKAREQSTSCTL